MRSRRASDGKDSQVSKLSRGERNTLSTAIVATTTDVRSREDPKLHHALSVSDSKQTP